MPDFEKNGREDRFNFELLARKKAGGRGEEGEERDFEEARLIHDASHSGRGMGPFKDLKESDDRAATGSLTSTHHVDANFRMREKVGHESFC